MTYITFLKNNKITFKPQNCIGTKKKLTNKLE
jgi:hypothetical protein